VTPKDLLATWLQYHGHRYPLTGDQQKRFTKAREVPLILLYPDADIVAAVEATHLLEQSLRILKGSKARRQTAAAPRGVEENSRPPSLRAPQTSLNSQVPSPPNKPATPSPSLKQPLTPRAGAEEPKKPGSAPKKSKPRTGGQSRSGRSRRSGEVWQAPVNREEAKWATVDFDRQDRHYP